MTSARMISLLDLLKIKGRLYSSFDDVDMTKLPPVEYSVVNSIIEQERNKSAEFLQTELARETTRQSDKQEKIAEYNMRCLARAKQDMPYLRYKYRLYKILSKITVGKLHAKFKQKRITYREKYYRVKDIIEKLGRKK